MSRLADFGATWRNNRRAAGPFIMVSVMLIVGLALFGLRVCSSDNTGTSDSGGGSISSLPAPSPTDPSEVSVSVRQAAEEEVQQTNPRVSDFIADAPVEEVSEPEVVVLPSGARYDEPEEAPVAETEEAQDSPSAPSEVVALSPGATYPESADPGESVPSGTVVLPQGASYAQDQGREDFYKPVRVQASPSVSQTQVSQTRVSQTQDSQTQDSQTQGGASGSGDTDISGQDQVAAGLIEASQWYGKLRFPWDSEVASDAVVDILSGPYQGKTMSLPLRKVSGHGVAGASSLGGCTVLAMRQDFSSPVFGRPSVDRRALRVLHSGLRHAFAGAGVVADAYTQWLTARAQPRPLYLTSGGTSEDVQRLEDTDPPKPDFGALAVAGAAASAAASFPELPDLPVRLSQGYVMGLAALCPAS